MSAESQAISEAFALHQAGQVEQALAAYREILPRAPGNADLLNLLGAACVHLGNLDEAADFLHQAIAINSAHPAALDNLGVLFAKQERFDDAIECLERSLALSPQKVPSLLNLASAQHKGGYVEASIATFRRILALDPNSARAHLALARNLKLRSEFAESALHYGEVARLKPGNFHARFEAADASLHAGDLAKAETQYREAGRLQPTSAEVLVNLAHIALQRKQYDQSEALARQAVALKPDSAEAHANLGSALGKLKRPREAIASLQEAVRLKPELAEAHNSLGIAVMDTGMFAAAEPHFRQALANKSPCAEYLHNLGLCLARQSRMDESLANYDQALTLKPEFADAHHNRAVALLARGQFGEGFGEYEWRFKASEFQTASPPWPRWSGLPEFGHTIVLTAEQGLGDTLQFIRYGALVHQHWQRVVVQCPQALHAILRGTPGIDALVTPEDVSVAADCCAPLLSLPHLLRATESFPTAPYLATDPKLVDQWRERLAQYQGLKIGIVWQGNPKCDTDPFRSIPLADFAPLAAIPGVQLINLQKGFGIEQLLSVQQTWNVIDLGREVDTGHGPFMDTAAIMQSLDLVITSDTAAAHLAGGLGVPVWTALNFVPDWRWLLEGQHSPWYPTMRLFRQQKWHDWASVFEEIAEALEELVSPRRTQRNAEND